MANARELIWKLSAKDSGMSDELSKLDSRFDKIKKKIMESDSAIGKFGGMMKLAGGNIKGFGDKISSTSQGIKDFGNKVTRRMLPVTLAMGKAVKEANNLDTAIRQVTTLTDESILPVAQLKKDVRELSDASGRGQKEIANAMYDALSSGVDQKNVKNFVKSGVNLMRAGFTDMPTVIDATTTALNAYGATAPKVEKIHDIFVKTQDLGKITVDGLGKSIGRVIPTAAAAGVGLEQLGAGYSILTSKGMNAEMSTTTLNGLLNELSTTGTKSDKALRKMTGKSFKDLTKEGKNIGQVLGIIDDQAKKTGLSLGDMFGSMEASKAANSLMSEGVEGYNKVLKEMENATGTTMKNAMKMMGPEEKMTMSINKMKNAALDAGATLAPFVVDMAEGISKLVTKFSELDPQTQSTIVQWVGLAIAAGPVISGIGMIGGAIGTVVSLAGGAVGLFGGLVSVFGSVIGVAGPLASGLFTVLAGLGPIGWAIMAVVAVGGYLIANWDKVKGKANELGGGLKGYLLASIYVVISGFKSMGSTALGVLNGIKNAWESAKNFLANPIKGVISIANNVAGAIKGTKGAATSGAVRKPQGSHANGLDYVPNDNYLANLHKGEMVLTRKASEEYRNFGGTKNGLLQSLTSNNTNNETINTISNKTISNQNNMQQGNFNPNITINLYGNTDDKSVTDIRDVVKSELGNMFRQLQLQRV